MDIEKAPTGVNSKSFNIELPLKSVSKEIQKRYSQIEKDSDGWSCRLVDFALDQRTQTTDIAAVLHRVNHWSEGSNGPYSNIKQIFGVEKVTGNGPISAGQGVNSKSSQYTLWAGRMTDRMGSHSGDVDFGSLSSVQAMGTGRTNLVVGFDTEYNGGNSVDGDDGERRIVSYQFCWIDLLDGSEHEVVIMPLESQRLLITDCLYTVSLLGGFERYANGFKVREEIGASSLDPRGVVRSELSGSSKHLRDELFKRASIRITLAGHFMQADATAFRRPKRRYDDVLHKMTSAGGGLVSLGSVRVVRVSGYGSYARRLPFSVIFRDTLNQASPDHKALSALGDACGVAKLDVGEAIEDMDGLSRDDLPLFLDYSANDARIVVRYLATVWGFNTVPPVTISSGGASALKAGVLDYLLRERFVDPDVYEDSAGESPNSVHNAVFRRTFQGLKRRKVEVDVDDDLNFYAVRSLEPVDGDARIAHSHWADAFCGGYNACLAPGAHMYKTYDWDLQSAYPSLMSAVIDPDYSDGGVIRKTIEKRELTLDDFPLGALTPIVGHVSWVFPESVAVPCLPVRRGGSLIYPRSSYGCGYGDGESGARLDEDGLSIDGDDLGGRDMTREELDAALATVSGFDDDGVFHGATCAAPEIWLALTLGARVFCQTGVEMKLLTREVDGEVEYSRSLRSALIGMVKDRATAKKVFGKKSLEELTIKVATNSCYGKLAQDIVDQNGWNAYAEEMENIGGSAVTSPYHASMTTALVRATLLAVANQVEILSATTDGVISSCDDLESLDLFGLADILRDSRRALADGDDSIWEIKHEQSDLINLSTRANVSLESGGVLAKGNIKTPKA